MYVCSIFCHCDVIGEIKCCSTIHHITVILLVCVHVLNFIFKLDNTNKCADYDCCLFSEASFCVQAKAVRDHCNIYDPNSLTFKDGELIKVRVLFPSFLWTF